MSDSDNNKKDPEPDVKKPKRKKLPKVLKIILIVLCVLAVLAAAWTAFSLIGRISAASLIPDSASAHVSISDPIRFLDGVLAHETLDDISALPALAQAGAVINMLKENPLLKNKMLRLAARGNLELALLSAEAGSGTLAAAWDLGFFSPLLRLLPLISGFIKVPNLYYVQAGANSRFEYRTEQMTLYIGPYRNLLFITNSSALFESRSTLYYKSLAASIDGFNIIEASEFDAALLLSNEFVGSLLSAQDPGIAELLANIEFDSNVEAGISVYQKKIEFRLVAPVSSRRSSLSLLLGQRSQTPGMSERIPADTQYATVLSAGTLNELYQAALVYSPDLDNLLKTADTSSRLVLGLTLDDLLFSWMGNEFAAFGMEGRPHPVYAIQIANERKRQEVFDKAFRSIVLNEDVRLNLDGTRIPRIEIPAFLQNLLRKWNIFLPSPYYIIYRDFLLASESAEALLSAMRSMQRNEVLPGTEDWRNISSGISSTSAFSLYYSLDLSVPFFLRKNTALSAFLSLYRQGLVNISFNRGIIDVSLSLVPGSGNGIALVSGYPLDIGISSGGTLSNRVYGAGNGEKRRVFFANGDTTVSVNLADNSIHELPGQGTHWVVPAEGRDEVSAWIVSDRGRITLVNEELEPLAGFPIISGLRLSAPPAAYEGKLYLCDESGKVVVVDDKGGQRVWETSFFAAVRSPPSFLTISGSGGAVSYATVYPKSFFGEIWLLDANGKVLPNWPAPTSVGDEAGSGIGFGSPLLFAHNERVYVAFVNQAGQFLVYDENADLVQPFPLNLDGIFYVQPVFDGEFLWLTSSDGNFFRVSLSGEVLYQKISGFSVMEEGYIMIFKTGGGLAPEVFITGEGNAMHAYTRNFRSLEGFPLPVWGKPLFIPAQSGRKAEIVGIGMDRRLYRWQFK